MAFSLIGYANRAVFADLFAAPAVSFVQQVIQSADPADMKAKFDAALQEIEALNVLIAAAFPEAPELLLGFADASLAGAGDGHTFTLTITWVASLLNASLSTLIGEVEGVEWFIPGEVSSLRGHFCMAATADALLAPWTAMVEALASEAEVPEQGTLTLWQAHAGASQGTRFMAGLIGGNRSEPEPPPQ